LAREYKLRPTPENREALMRYAAAHGDAHGALALLAAGVVDLNLGRLDAVAALGEARAREPKLADWSAYLLAKAHFQARRFDASAEAAQVVLGSEPPSPVAGSAALVGAKAYLAAGKAENAVQMLLGAGDRLLQPAGDMTLGSAYEAVGDRKSAALAYQRVWLDYPETPEAKEAEAALNRVGPGFAEIPAAALLRRAGKLAGARDFARARQAYQSLAALESTSAVERELARVRIGVVDYQDRRDAAALSYLSGLTITTADVDAERLFYVLACARRLDRLDTMDDAVRQLSRKYPTSEWRLRALVAAGNEYLLLNRPESFEPLYQTCAEQFPDSSDAPYCQWRLAFSAYRQDRSTAGPLLQAHLMRFPRSNQASGAMYFLGRLAERSVEWDVAHTYYARIELLFPNDYYAVLARERLAHPDIARAGVSKDTTAFLTPLPFPRKGLTGESRAAGTAAKRFERARLLNIASLGEFAEIELKFGARTGQQAEAYGLELARLAAGRSDTAQSIRYLKRYTPGYLYSRFEAAPPEFWRLAFPWPWRETIEKYSLNNELDPFIVVALIRQESEFDARALSRSDARGLTQILPSTGRELSRRLHLRGFRTSLLYDPAVNLRLGALYLKLLVARFDGGWEPTLAAYNAGGRRVAAWLGAGPYREPAEFVESIPFSETRHYVQLVLRNADLYRRLYGSQSVSKALAPSHR
jgi:soluble lytic murein transglycosylase